MRRMLRRKRMMRMMMVMRMRRKKEEDKDLCTQGMRRMLKMMRMNMVAHIWEHIYWEPFKNYLADFYREEGGNPQFRFSSNIQRKK